MKQETKRLYSMADADLKQLADDLKDSIVRDAAEFATRMVDSTKIAGFDTLIANFEAIPTDIELLGMVTVAVEAKNKLADNIHIAIRSIRGIAEDTFGKSGKLNVFGFDDMTRLSDNKLVQMAKRVVRVGITTSSDLALKGLQPTQLTDLGTLATALDNAIDDVHDAEENRDMQTQIRIEKGNLLYTQLVKLAAIGKNLFADTDEARYNDYVVISNKAAPDDDTPPVP